MKVNTSRRVGSSAAEGSEGTGSACALGDSSESLSTPSPKNFLPPMLRERPTGRLGLLTRAQEHLFIVGRLGAGPQVVIQLRSRRLAH